MQSTPDQILFALKTRGPTGIRDLATCIGITRQAARAIYRGWRSNIWPDTTRRPAEWAGRVRFGR